SGSGPRLSIAVVGSGISGMSCAWLLSQRHDVTVLETQPRLGGHTNTQEVPREDQTRTPVDTGFIVYNTWNYPNLVALFDHLGVKTQASDMSFAVSLDNGRLEYSGSGFSGLLAQPANLLRPRFWAMTRDILRFFKQAETVLGNPEAEAEPLGAYLRRNGYSKAFMDDHLLPMGAAIWSTPTLEMEDYPTGAFVRFFSNHGLLNLKDRPVWRTVTGGSREYARLLTAAYADRIELGQGVRRIRRLPDGVEISDADGKIRRFDHVVIASHADEALAMLEKPSREEERLLGAFAYQANEAWLHSDPNQMPKRKKAWASWNYLGRAEADGGRAVALSYWMNLLQSLPSDQDIFVTLNPFEEPDPAKVYGRFQYTHPMFDGAAVAARRDLWDLQGVQRTWFCGSYFGDGFHEDGLQSGLAVAEDLGGLLRPWSVQGQDGRIARKPLTAEARAHLIASATASGATSPGSPSRVPEAAE
ncbi:MAG: NAD(P)/FAD-dependent oxidoreductase, partial [Rhodospirillaceae bacterium]